MRLMPAKPNAQDRLAKTADRLERFEAGPSIAKTGTGARREGPQFERLVRVYWDALADCAIAGGASLRWSAGQGTR
jgi:hypothetical protein